MHICMNFGSLFLLFVFVIIFTLLFVSEGSWDDEAHLSSGHRAVSGAGCRS